MSSNQRLNTAGKYRLIFELGRGGMADVMLAVLEGPGGFNKLQVLKFLRGELADDPDFCTMFLDEARLSARINHPNVTQTNEVGFDGNRYFIAMEYLEGHTLDELMRIVPRDRLSIPIVLRIVADACAGLHFAHELKNFDGTRLNVIHRDVSPHNIFVTYDGVVKLLDFGIAKASDSKSRTEAGTIKGKIAYMAPEQLIAPNLINSRADIFSVGAILWRVITGRRLWSGATEMEVLQRLAVREIPEPTPLPGTPDELIRICKKAIAPDPNDRYATAALLQADLESLITALGGATYSDVDALVNSVFAERRREVRAAIDARLSSPHTTGVTHVSSLPRLGPEVARAHFSRSGSGSSVLTQGVIDLESSKSASLGAVRPVRSNWGLAMAAALVAVGLVGAAFVLRPRAEIQPVIAQSESSPKPASAAPIAPKTETDLVFDVSPSNAHVVVDDVTLTGKPPRGTFPQDGRDHSVRVQADGYATRTLNVKFSAASVRVEVALEKERRPTAQPSRPAGKRGIGQSVPTAPDPVLPTATAPLPTTPPAAKIPAPAAPASTVDALDKDDPWKR